MDFDKVLARARELTSARPIKLRWEGSGDSVHAYTLLNQLRQATYSGELTKIKYNAVINIYEPFENANAQKAWKYMASIHDKLNLRANGATGEIYCDEFYNDVDEQYCLLYYDMDVTRDSRITEQPTADIMFVRNIMMTNDYQDSLTHDTAPLLNLHKQAVRKRAGSLAGGGVLRLGMSGAPGFIKPNGADRSGRGPVKISEAFHGFSELRDEALAGGLTPQTHKTTGKRSELTINDDYDTGPVMLNRGVQENKRTYYLTFQAPN